MGIINYCNYDCFPSGGFKPCIKNKGKKLITIMLCLHKLFL